VSTRFMSLKNWNLCFEFLSKCGYMFGFNFAVLVCAGGGTLQRGDTPFKESYQMYKGFIISELILNGMRLVINVRKYCGAVSTNQ
jgi:hypothetical protein